MKTEVLKNIDIAKGNLILVNREYSYRGDISEKALVAIDDKNKKVLLEERIACIFKKLIEELCAFEDITAISGWRSQLEQERIYKSSALDNGAEFTKKFVALPGHSEHQTGLAIDLALKATNIDFLRPNFPYTGVCKAFRKKALRFGFVERYPKGKESITDIAHEPWHFRYVGSPHSEIIMQFGFALEEYIAFLKQYPYGGTPFIYNLAGYKTEVSYLAAEKGVKTPLEISDDFPYLVSGNNIDGFIITVWKSEKRISS
ncbi:MAG: D-alanyl-D-alanine carboxypeptidase family protein [Clostridia bacterium]